MTKVLSLILFISAFSASAEGLKLHKCRNLAAAAYQECDLEVSSPKGVGQSVYVKAYIPARLSSSTSVIVFLHGRSHSHPMGQGPTMIEDVGIEKLLSTPALKNHPHIVLAPQDTFVDQIGLHRGEDYWLGRVGRNWETFLTEELPKEINSHYHLKAQPWKAMGISMGAHGAMKLAIDHPAQYAAFAALSPVFRATKSEMTVCDADVLNSQNNLGERLLSACTAGQKFKLPPHFIQIHHTDFALAKKEFPSSLKIWDYLKSQTFENSLAEISYFEGARAGEGHSMAYWHHAFPQAVNWLVSQKTCENVANGEI